MGKVKRLRLKMFIFVNLNLYLLFESYLKLQEEFECDSNWVGN
jgi:hypothetical protein